jgi:kumamolisin
MGIREILGLLCVVSLSLAAANSANADTSGPQDSDESAKVRKPGDGHLILRLQERVPIEELANSVTDASSPQYGKVYTAEEIRAISGPTDADYHTLLQTLATKGFEVTRESPTHLWVEVLPKLQLNIKTWDQKLHVDLPLVDSVIGFDHSRKARPLAREIRHQIRREIHHNVGLKNSYSFPIQFGPLGPDWIRSAYGFDPIYQAGLSGKNQFVAIVSYGGFYKSDVQKYFEAEKISPSPTVDEIEVGGPVSVTRESMGETAMDVEFSGMIAPGSHLLVYESSHNDDAGDVELFNAILDDGRAKVVSYSWGNCELAVSHQHLLDMNKIFARAVAQGVNIVVGSGDFGAEGCPGDSGLNADWPASSPYVVAVGGTSIQSGARGDVQETAWADSGGGVSGAFEKPTWQRDLPFERRAFPDVAFNADATSGEPAWIHKNFADGPVENGVVLNGDEGGEWATMGGTSIAAPQWAGFLALVNEARSKDRAKDQVENGTDLRDGKAPLGFLNPRIYNLRDDQRESLFHDITQGSNDGYDAGLGWDAVTGWGSMRASPLLEYLKNI